MSAVMTERQVTVRDGLRHDWRLDEVEALFELPFMDLMYRAQTGPSPAPRAQTACR